MINTSNEYKSLIRRNRKFIPKASLTLADSTVLNLEPGDIMQGGLKIEDSVGDKVALGTAIINKCSLTLNNFSGKFNAYDFSGAVTRPYVGLQLSETVEYLAKGVFTTDRPVVNGSIIILEALDNMSKFDTEFSAVQISFPCTALQLLQAVCVHCGVSLATVSFLNSAYVINNRPDDESIGCREIVSWVAQLAGCFARCNTQGALELNWYDFQVFESESNLDGGTFDSSTPYSSGDSADGGNFIDYSSGDSYDGGNFADMRRYHHLYSFSGEPTIGTDDVIITGIQVTDTSENPVTALFGTTGYVLPITGNKLIQNASQAALIANSVGQKIVGMRFRSFFGNAQSDPAMEAGDVAYVSTRKGFSYPILFTSLSYTLGDNEPVSCGAETPARNRYRPTPEMKAIIEARNQARQQISAYDLAVQRMTNLIAHAFGLHETEKTLEDGSKIFYKHDKPTLSESSYIYQENSNGFFISNDGGVTWNSGWDADGNAVMNVLSAIGVDAEWIKVLTSFTVGDNFSVDKDGNLKALSGQLGPFVISNQGLASPYMQLFDDGGNPVMWVTKPGVDGGGWGTEGSQRSNHEAAVAVYRSIADGIETDVVIQARDDGSGGIGKVEIEKWEKSTGETISRQRISDDGIELEEDFVNGWAEKASQFTTGFVAFTNGNQLGMITFEDDGTIDINCDHLTHNGIPI